MSKKPQAAARADFFDSHCIGVVDTKKRHSKNNLHVGQADNSATLTGRSASWLAAAKAGTGNDHACAINSVTINSTGSVWAGDWLAA